MTLRESALAIFTAAVAAADPANAVRKVLTRDGDLLRVNDRTYDLARGRVFTVGIGKASVAMAEAVQAACAGKVAAGVVVTKYGHNVSHPGDHPASHATHPAFQVIEAGHPLPDENSVRGAQAVLDLLSQANENDLVLCLISGGGSALFELPVDGVTLDDMRATTDALLRCGATIDEVNTLRKHLSQVKGGQLARSVGAAGGAGAASRAGAARRASVASGAGAARRSGGGHIISLILSDVVGSPLDAIASGPTAPDPTTFADALSVIERRGIRKQLPRSVVAHVERGARGEIQDTPTAGDPVFSRVQNVIVADNAIACAAAVEAARARGLNPLLLTTLLQGEAREAANFLAAIAREIARSGRPVARPACVIAGGETTVTLRGNGKGGRNQELALAAAIEIAGMDNVVILSAGTDGTDGATDAAGAIADGSTVERAQALGLDARQYLADNNAYHFFQPLNDLVVTGPTGTNVDDVMLVLVE
jgi:hydroxypyruvate reductase